MTYEPNHPTPADPASTEPSAARPESCACCGAVRADGPAVSERAGRYLRMLDELADLGMELARRMMARVREEDDARHAAQAAARLVAPDEPAAPMPMPSPNEPALAGLTVEERAADEPGVLGFQRLTRAVRLCMALALKIEAGWPATEQGKPPAGAGTARKAGRRHEVERRVKDAIAQEGERVAEREGEADPLAVEMLHRALSERLDDDTIERDLDRYSVEELVERICRDLGIEPPAEPGADAEEGDGPPFEEAWPGAGVPLDGEAWAIDYQFFVDIGFATPPVSTFVGPDPYLILQPLPPLPDTPGRGGRGREKSSKRPARRPSG